MRYVYPVILYADDGMVGVSVPDLPGCHTFGEDDADALFMAADAMAMWLWHAENTGMEIPVASENITAMDGERVSLVAADTAEYRRQNDTRAVKKTLSIPAWLNYQAEAANAPFSRILQEGLKEFLAAK
ncbi:MAG: type II toxin-antitoxin system HicB family antitoxin [Defluviitaleaceae bacterium]|nr:type II toxin-antitoxin system HicB family antitoxin [Defluviitaleaceae bacterium]